MSFGDPYRALNRQDFLRLSGAGIAGAVLLGTAGGKVLAQAGSSLKAEFESASAEYKVPIELLLAMGYVNTLWEMPPPEVSDYEPGDLHGRGAYGIMQLVKNPSQDTLGRAASLTGLSEEELKNNRAANVRGGAAVLADIQGEPRPDDLNGWQGAVVEYGDAGLYAEEVFETLKSGASATISTGESLQLSPQEDVEVPQLVTVQSSADYRRAAWRPAYRGNYTNSDRGAAQIDVIVLHVAEGSFSGTINWFQNPRANVSAHFVVSGNGRIAQCVHSKDIAWQAGDWGYNKRSIGIEHAGYGSNPRTWTKRMLRASARLSAYMSRRYGVPVDSRHFLPHRSIVATRCPGPHFDLGKYLRLVRRYR